MNLNKTMFAALTECAKWCIRGRGYGMHEAWKPKTMPKLASLGLVEKQDHIRTGFTHGPGWVLTEAGRAALALSRPHLLSREKAEMYCSACDRWEDDQIALECETCLRCGGNLCQPDDDEHEPDDVGGAQGNG